MGMVEGVAVYHELVDVFSDPLAFGDFKACVTVCMLILSLLTSSLVT